MYLGLNVVMVIYSVILTEVISLTGSSFIPIHPVTSTEFQIQFQIKT